MAGEISINKILGGKGCKRNNYTDFTPGQRAMNTKYSAETFLSCRDLGESRKDLFL